MRLKVFTPAGVLVDEAVTKVNAEAQNGAFCLLPRHIDFAAELVPGLLSFTRNTAEDADQEVFLAVDEGLLVKRGPEVSVATRQAVQDEDLAHLRHTLKTHFETLNEQEKQLRLSLAKLEADFVRRFTELKAR